MISGIELLMLFIMLVCSAAIATVLLRRRKFKTHPACGGCGYDVTGSVGTSDRCPECGGFFTDVGIIPAGPPKDARTPTVIIVIAASILTLTCMGGALFSMSAGAQRNAAARAATAARAQVIAAQAQAEAAAQSAAEIDRSVHDLPPEEAVNRLRERLDAEPDPSIRELLMRVLDRLEETSPGTPARADGIP